MLHRHALDLLPPDPVPHHEQAEFLKLSNGPGIVSRHRAR